MLTHDVDGTVRVGHCLVFRFKSGRDRRSAYTECYR